MYIGEIIKSDLRLVLGILLVILFVVIRLTQKSWGMIMARIIIGGFFLLLVPTIFGLLFFSPNREELIWRITAGLIGLFLGFMGLMTLFPRLAKLFPKLPPKKCNICSQPARDVFVVNGKREGVYCRKHVMQKFEQAFRSFPFSMVVFHPEQEREYCSTMYPYYPLTEMVSLYSFEKEAAENIRNILSQIHGACQDCKDKTATIAYYPKGVLTWIGTGPLLAKVKAAPKLLCTECTLKLISPALTANKDFFVDSGLFAPYKEKGVFVNTEL